MTDINIETAPPKVVSMAGWKTKWGTIMLAIGTALLGASDAAPKPEMIVWLKFIGTLLTGFGTALAAWGLGHKLEKNRTVVNVSNVKLDPKLTGANVVKE